MVILLLYNTNKITDVIHVLVHNLFKYICAEEYNLFK